MSFSSSLITFCLVAAPIGFLIGAPFVASGPFIRVPCSSAALNGVVEFGCWGYKECKDGVIIRHECPNNQVFERETMSCVETGTDHTDCNKTVSCFGRNDGLYADREHSCQTYVTCHAGYNMGRQYCPANLVFNETVQICDYIDNTEPPCGTKLP